MFDILKILNHQSKQYIPDVLQAVLPEVYTGKPEIAVNSCKPHCRLCAEVCPSDAIALNPVSIDLGRCVFCKECEKVCELKKIGFSNNHQLSSNEYHSLVISEGHSGAVRLNPERIRKEIIRCFGNSLKLRLVSAGSCNGCELELNASGNVNFDMGRFGIEFLASPRHCDGVVLTGPLVQNSVNAFEITMEAIPRPKILILAGSCAVSGGIFKDSSAVMRNLIEKYNPDLLIPGCPPHPLTIITGIVQLMRNGNRSC